MTNGERIEVENVITPGSRRRVDAAKYHAIRDAMLAVLPSKAPGLTPAEIKTAILPRIPDDLFPGGDKAGWWIKCVQLDLEAKGVLGRVEKPVRLHRS